MLGPLVSARLEHGDVVALCKEAASRVWEHPVDGRLVTLSWRTIEGWYYAHRAGGLDALMPGTRKDAGTSRAIRAGVADLLLRAKREKPRRSVRRLIKMLVRAGVVRKGELSRSSVHRLLQQHGISGRPGREGVTKERRAWSAEHAGDLWVGDALHLRRPVVAGGRLRKAYLLSQIDSCTRFVPHSYFALREDAAAQEYGLREAMLKHGWPRGYYVDRGAAYVARSLRAICAELEIHLTHASPGDGAAKGVIERWHRTFREEVEDELPDTPLTLDELNALYWAWLSREYHRREHDTTKRAPLEHWLAEAHHVRSLPRGTDLAEIFLHRATRDVRMDSTIKWRGGLLEVHWTLAGKKRVELRYAPDEPDALPRVFVDGRFVCDTTPLDRVKNASRTRRTSSSEPDPDVEPTGLDPLRLIADEHYRSTRRPGAEEE